jgi:Ca-activated chloride channel homolog
VVESQGCADIVVKQAGGRLLLSGRLLASRGSLKENTYGTMVHLDRAQAAAGEILAGKWAGAHLQKLALLPDSHPEDLLALARRYGVVSPQTSLLVLETIDQYLEYGIEPPATRPTMLAEYREFRQEMVEMDKEARADHLEEVVSLWHRRVEWWQTEFAWKPQPPPIVYGRNRTHVEESLPNQDLDSSSNRLVVNMDEVNFFPPRSLDSEVCSSPTVSESYSMATERDEGDTSELMLAAAANPSVTALMPWSPDAPYLSAMKGCATDEAYAVYLGQRAEYAKSPAFFFDCGDYFLAHHDRQTGLKILSNLLEMNLEDVALMRMYAWRLQQAGELEGAITVFRRVHALRDDEPQSYRDLALALADRWEQQGEGKDIREAMDLLYQVVLREWERFPEIELIALMELNRLIYLAGKSDIAAPDNIDRRLIKLLDLDIRVSMAWDADLTDIDLHVYEPTGEHACYSHQKTAVGGLVSRDFREGYGPEEYILRRAVPGTYQIKAHYFGSHQQSLCGPCTVMVQVFTDYCRPEEKKQTLSLRLDQAGSDFLVGEVFIAKTQESDIQENKAKQRTGIKNPLY